MSSFADDDTLAQPVQVSYDTPLTPDEETQFQEWKAKNAPNDSGADYDLRGAFKEGIQADPTSGHWPDTYKKPNHPTFSIESKYAVGDDAAKAGKWDGENFIKPVQGSSFNSDDMPVSSLFTSDREDTPAPKVEGGSSFSKEDAVKPTIKTATEKRDKLEPLTREESDLLFDADRKEGIGSTAIKSAGAFAKGLGSAVAAVPRGALAVLKSPFQSEDKSKVAEAGIMSGAIAQPVEDVADMAVNAAVYGTGITDWARGKVGNLDENQLKERYFERTEARRQDMLEKMQNPDRIVNLLKTYGVLSPDAADKLQEPNRKDLSTFQDVSTAAGLLSPNNPYVLPGKILGKIPFLANTGANITSGLRNIAAGTLSKGGGMVEGLGKFGVEKLGGLTDAAREMAEKVSPTLAPLTEPGWIRKGALATSGAVQAVGEGVGAVGRNMSKGFTAAERAKLEKFGDLGIKVGNDVGYTSRDTVFNRILDDQKAPGWIKGIAKIALNVKVPKTNLSVAAGISRADDLLEDAVSGATFGAGVGALTGENPEDVAESAGFGAGVGPINKLLTTSPEAVRTRRENSDLARFLVNIPDKDASNLAMRLSTFVNTDVPGPGGKLLTPEQKSPLVKKYALDIADAAQLAKQFTDADVRFLTGSEYNARRVANNDGGQNTSGVSTLETHPVTGARKQVIDINVDSPDLVNGSIAHELVHHLESLDGMKEPMAKLDQVLFDTVLPGETKPIRKGVYSNEEVLAEGARYNQQVAAGETESYRRGLISAMGGKTKNAGDLAALEAEAVGKFSQGAVDALKAKAFSGSNRRESARKNAITQGGDVLTNYLNEVKSEIRAESVRNVFNRAERGKFRSNLDSKASQLADWALTSSQFTKMGKLREFLKSQGIDPASQGAQSQLSEQPVVGRTATPEVEAAVRDFLRTKASIQDTLNADNAPKVTTFDAAEVVNTPELTEQYKDWDAFDRELVEVTRDKNGEVVAEERVPENLQKTAGTGDFLKTKSGGTITIEQRIKRAPGVKAADGSYMPGAPILRSDREIERIAKDRGKLIDGALRAGGLDDQQAGVPLEVGPYSTPMVQLSPGQWRGLPSENQLKRLLDLPDHYLPAGMKEKVKTIVEQMRGDYGRRFLMEYQPALKKGKYSSKLTSTLRDEVPLGFNMSKARNFFVTTLSMTGFNNKLERWMSNPNLRGRFKDWNGDPTDFFTDTVGMLEHYSKSEQRGEEYFKSKGDDADTAIRKKNIINDFINIKNLDTLKANPDRVEQLEGGDNLVRSRRIDRITRLEPIDNRLPRVRVNYGKQLSNYMPKSKAASQIKQTELNFKDLTPADVAPTKKIVPIAPEERDRFPDTDEQKNWLKDAKPGQFKKKETPKPLSKIVTQDIYKNAKDKKKD